MKEFRDSIVNQNEKYFAYERCLSTDNLPWAIEMAFLWFFSKME